MLAFFFIIMTGCVALRKDVYYIRLSYYVSLQPYFIDKNIKKWKDKIMIDTYTPTIIKNVATQIDLLRTEQNLSVRDLAKRAGISKSQLSDIILGNKIPTVYTLHLICTALGISLSDFFNFDNSIIRLRSKEAILIKIYRELYPMSQDTLIKVTKCMKWTKTESRYRGVVITLW